MKIKVFEAKGKALDWLVAKAEGRLGAWIRDTARPGTSILDVCFDECRQLVVYVPGRARDPYVPWSPSTDGAQAVPIIEQAGIDLRKRVPDPSLAHPDPRFTWKAELVATNPYFCGTGPTLLIAAMRCFVASRLGEEVEVPKELLS